MSFEQNTLSGNESNHLVSNQPFTDLNKTRNSKIFNSFFLNKKKSDPTQEKNLHPKRIIKFAIS